MAALAFVRSLLAARPVPCPAAPRRARTGRVRRLVRRLRRDRRGVAGLEFALGAPLLLFLAVIGFDVARYAIYVRKVQLTASTMANFLARNQTGTINWDDLDAVFQTQLVVFPEIMDAARERKQWVWSTVLSSLSGVRFTAPANCGSTCSYTPYVAWTAGVRRSCGVPLKAAVDPGVSDPGTLPADTFGPGFLIVADVSFDYRPIFARSVVGDVTIKRSFYVAPRYVSAITYDSSRGGNAVVCPIP